MGQLASCCAKTQEGTITLGKNGKSVAISTVTVSNFMHVKNQGWKIEKSFSTKTSYNKHAPQIASLL